MNANLMSFRRGFTLIELMIVVAIIAILSAIAMPLYQEQLRKSARSQAKGALMQIAQLQERYYTANNTYQASLTTLLGIAGASVYSGGQDFTDASGKHVITMAVGSGAAACATITCGFVLTATPTATFPDPKCATFTLSSTGVRGFTGTGTARDCW